MTTFRYKGVSENGVKVSGVINAYNEYEAVSKLRERVSIITSVEEVKEEKVAKQIGGAARFKGKDLSIMASQFSIILSSGLPIVRCVEMVAAQVTDKELHKMLEKVAQDVAGGYTLAQSFENNCKTLPITFIETVRAGEASGTLEESFKRLEQYFEKASKVKDKVKGALTYPIIVIVVALIVAAIVLIKAVPAFKTMFDSMGVDLPGVTRFLIAISDFLIKGWPWILMTIVVCLISKKLLDRTEKGRLFFAEFKLSKSPFKKINLMNGASQFANTLSTMLTSGLPVNKALGVTANVMTNYVLCLAVRKLVDGVEQGHSVSESMEQCPYFPKLLIEMTGVGEESGSMEEVLDVIGSYYDNEVSVQTTRLLALLEPIITVGLAVITVVLLLSVYLPMFSMYDAI